MSEFGSRDWEAQRVAHIETGAEWLGENATSLDVAEHLFEAHLAILSTPSVPVVGWDHRGHEFTSSRCPQCGHVVGEPHRDEATDRCAWLISARACGVAE